MQSCAFRYVADEPVYVDGLFAMPTAFTEAVTRRQQESALLSAIRHSDRATDKARFRIALDRVRQGN